MADESLTESILTKELVYPGKIIRLEHWQVRLPNGHTALREVACHPGASAVVALDDQNRLLLVRQHRPAVGRVTLEIPAGKLDSAEEDPLDCAKRELSEETGCTAAHWQKLVCLETTPGFCNERIHIYLATGLSGGSTHPDDDEFVETVRLPLQEALTLAENGSLRDAKTLSGILLAARHIN